MNSGHTNGHTAGSAWTREQELLDWIRERESVLLGFSGGLDSTYLAAVAVEALERDRFLAVTGLSPSYPESQWRSARRIATELGLRVREVHTRELEDPRYAANSTDRCYHCKRELWSRLLPIAREERIRTVIDGTNADDQRDYRPGRAAALEFGVESPLAILGFSKAEVRERLRERGISIWPSASSPCLSSRISYGLEVTPLRLRRVETAEAALRELGFDGDLRVRLHGELARVELDEQGFAILDRPEMLERLRVAVSRAGFQRVTIDARGFRSGSLNVLAAVVPE